MAQLKKMFFNFHFTGKKLLKSALDLYYNFSLENDSPNTYSITTNFHQVLHHKNLDKILEINNYCNL